MMSAANIVTNHHRGRRSITQLSLQAKCERI